LLHPKQQEQHLTTLILMVYKIHTSVIQQYLT